MPNRTAIDRDEHEEHSYERQVHGGIHFGDTWHDKYFPMPLAKLEFERGFQHAP